MLFNIDEKQLMLKLKNKDERALKICMNKYYRYVVYIVENIIGSALPYEDKEEVVSNVFVALWNYSADLDTDNYSTFKPYLGTIARNMAKNALRKTSKMHFENYEDAFQVGTNEHIEYGPLKEEVIKCLKESIYELSVDERKCFIHKNLIGYVYCDDRVAFVLNIFLERFVNDTVDYHIHYVGVDSLDEECIECRKYSDYCEHILPAFWIDDDFCE